jgi:hypothetical protein
LRAEVHHHVKLVDDVLDLALELALAPDIEERDVEACRVGFFGARAVNPVCLFGPVPEVLEKDCLVVCLGIVSSDLLEFMATSTYDSTDRLGEYVR